MFVTRAVLTRWLRASMILYSQARCLRANSTFDAVEAEFINDEQVELGIEADAVRMVRSARAAVKSSRSLPLVM